MKINNCSECIYSYQNTNSRQLFCNKNNRDVTNLLSICDSFISKRPIKEEKKKIDCDCTTCNYFETQNHGRKLLCNRENTWMEETSACSFYKEREKTMNPYQKEITKNINNMNKITIEKKMVFTVEDCEMDRTTFFELMGEFITDDESEKAVNGICDFIETMEASIPYNTKIIILTPEKPF